MRSGPCSTGSPGPNGPERLVHPTLVFQSNFSVDLDHYIDTFVHASPMRIRAVWLGARGRPWLFPFRRYLAWVAESSLSNAHYYCAYPSATTTEVVSAIAVRDAMVPVRAAARSGDAARRSRRHGARPSPERNATCELAAQPSRPPPVGRGRDAAHP